MATYMWREKTSSSSRNHLCWQLSSCPSSAPRAPSSTGFSTPPLSRVRLLSLSLQPLTDPTSPLPRPHSFLRRAHHRTCRRTRRPRWLAPSRAVPSLFAPHAPANDLAKSSKISNVLSFFPIKDAAGTTQLVVRRNLHDRPDLPSLSGVPVESSVLIHGRVSERPKKDRRSVSSSSFPSSCPCPHTSKVWHG